jgi:hypothetical protein
MRRLPHGSAVGCLQEPLVCRSLFQSAVAPREELNLQTADRGFSVRCATTQCGAPQTAEQAEV